MPASASRRPNPAATLLSIGQVLDQLREEFPDLSHSKLHYLESEDLISPQRTPSGYRKYSREDIDTLVFVLRAQRDRFWPLKVIKDHLSQHGTDGGEVTSIASRPGPSAQLRSIRLDRRGLLQEARVEESFVRELEEYGMLETGVIFYGATELELVRAAAALAEQGLHPRHLVMVRSSVQRQAHMVRSVAQPHSRTQDSAARGGAEDLARDLGEQLNTLHASLLRVALRSS